jgi:hypothetical protein
MNQIPALTAEPRCREWRSKNKGGKKQETKKLISCFGERPWNATAKKKKGDGKKERKKHYGKTLLPPELNLRSGGLGNRRNRL